MPQSLPWLASIGDRDNNLLHLSKSSVAEAESDGDAMNRNLQRIKIRIRLWMRKRGKDAFLRSLPDHARIIDIGCGNSSPMKTKMLRSDLTYVGLDIGDYNQTSPRDFADQYIIVSSSEFADAIGRFEGQMDAVVSSHNIEHCTEPQRVLEQMLASIKIDGRIYLSFPCEESVNFPKRRGTLNFYDDTTHNKVPRWDSVLNTIKQAGFVIDHASKRYRPIGLMLIGSLLEPTSAILRVNLLGTWEFE
jgi:SAM-dependent methyltransferase